MSCNAEAKLAERRQEADRLSQSLIAWLQEGEIKELLWWFDALQISIAEVEALLVGFRASGGQEIHTPQGKGSELLDDLLRLGPIHDELVDWSIAEYGRIRASKGRN